ncbi:hypothetical protein AWV80_40250 [Cupriavidus sp. UYMU48A]|nr:hypothetical protein AWV80_40250 [Cupriavidus sp. UYMU48A]
MVTTWFREQGRGIPDRLAAAVAALLVAVMSCFLALYGHGLFLRILQEQVSTDRLHLLATHESKARQDYFIARFAQMTQSGWRRHGGSGSAN